MFKFFSLFFLTLALAFAGGSTTQKIATGHHSIFMPIKNAQFSQEQIGSYTHQKLFTCNNNLEGSFEYVSDGLIMYVKDTLKSSTHYKCEPDRKLLGSKATSLYFSTEDFSLIDAQFFPNGTIRIEFNDKVKIQELQKNLLLIKEQKLTRTELSYHIKAAEDFKSFVVQIDEDITDATISIKVKKSLENFSKKPLQREYQKSFSLQERVYVEDKKRRSMTLYDKPRFIALEDGSLAIRVYFEGSFYEGSNAKEFIKIRGIKSFQLSESNYVSFTERKRYHLSEKSYYSLDILADFKPQNRYEISLLKGLKDDYDLQLREDKSYLIFIGDRKPALEFETYKPYLSSLGEIGFTSTNISKINLVVEKLLDQNYRYFLNFDRAESASLEYLGAEVLSKSFALDGKRNAFVKHKISLKPFIKNLKSGVYRIIIHYDGDREASRAVYFSDLGILAKISNDQLFVSVARLSNTEAIAGAKVALYSAKNELILTGETRKDGTLSKAEKNMAQKIPRSIVVSYKDEQNFLILDEALNGVAMPYKESVHKRFKAFIYFQSQLIRPEGELKALIVIKDKEFLSSGKIPLKITITDPMYREIFSQNYTTNEVGAVDFALPMLKEYKTGRYILNVHFANRILASKSFSLEAFLPQKIKNEIRLDKKSYTLGEIVEANLSSSYLFGAPAAHLSAEVRLSALAKNYTSKKYKAFSFSNQNLQKTNRVNYLDENRYLHLNQKGEVILGLALHVSQRVPSMLEAQLALSVFDDGRAVSSYKRFDLYAYKQMVGVRTLKKSITKDESMEFDTVVIDPKSQKLIESPLDVIIKRYEWRYLYDTQGNSTWSKEYEILERFTVDSHKRFSRKFTRGGSYIIEVYDRLSGHSSSKEFRVSSWDYTPISPTDDMQKVQVSFKDRPYKKGEILKISLRSPIRKGRLLVSLEREKVLWHKVVAISQGVANFDIALDYELQDGMYLHTSVLSPTDKASKLIPFRASSSDYIKPNREEHLAKVSIRSPKTAHSNEDIVIEVTGEKNSYTLVTLVDSGILQISGQKPPKPFEYFLRKADEKVASYDIYDQVMHYLTEGKMLSFGGDAAKELLQAQKHKAPDTGAKRVKPFLYYSKLLKTDAQGKASFKVHIPDFNGEARIVAINITADSIGAESLSLKVRDDIIIKPTYPRFMLVNDSLSIPVRVFNTSSKEIQLSLSTRSSKHLHVSTIDTTISLAAHSSQLIMLELEAKAFGKGEITILAKGSQKSYFHTLELPVISANSLQTYQLKGELSSAKEFKIPQKYLLKETPAHLSLSISNNFLSQLTGDMRYLIEYPYGCVEQMSSKMFAMAYLQEYLKTKESKERQNLLHDRAMFIKEGLAKLTNLQKESGEFAYWSRGGYVNPYASIYASDLLLHVREFGFKVPKALLDRANNALKSLAQGRGSYRYGGVTYFERMYAAYLLSEQNILDTSLINTLYDKKIYSQNLSSHYLMAAILKKASMHKEMQKLMAIIEKYDFSKLSKEREYARDFYTSAGDLSFSLYLHVSNFKKNALSKRLLEAAQRESKSLYSTHEKAMAIRAFATYYRGEVNNKMDFSLEIDGKKERHFKSFTQNRELKTDTLQLNSHKLINYTIEVSQYLPRELKHHKKLQESEGVNIRRSFVDVKGREINLQDIRLGDLLYSKIEIQSNQKIQNLVINDRVPSCLEIVNERLYSQERSKEIQNSRSFRPDYQEILDDRVLTFLSLTGNKISYFTPLRATTLGACQMPAVTTEAMYDSRLSDYDREYKSIEVKN